MDKVVRKAMKHCRKLFQNSRCEKLPFHNIAHTLEVYDNVKKIGAFENIPYKDLEPVLLAALFHDTGNAFRFQGHEYVSRTYAILFMEKNGYNEKLIEKVCNNIIATKIPQNPTNIYESIICDADLFHLGTRSFESKIEMLRREWSKYLELEYSDDEWKDLSIEFMKQHRFHTKYGEEILEPIKQENLKKITSSFKEKY